MANQVPVCARCNHEFRCIQMGVILEMVASWGSYYKVRADKYGCPCGNEIYYGFADKRYYQHEDGYQGERSDVQVSV